MRTDARRRAATAPFATGPAAGTDKVLQRSHVARVVLLRRRGTFMDPSGRFTDDGRQKYADRLFFALRPDLTNARRIADFALKLCKTNKLRGTLLRPDLLHVTLQWIGDFREGIPSWLLAKVRECAARVDRPAFGVAFGTAATLGSAKSGKRNYAGVLRDGPSVRPLLDLQTALQAELAECLSPTMLPRSPIPHMTLFYGSAMAPRPVSPVPWRASTFVLLRSVVGLTEHHLLDSWPLSNDAAP
jgi:RNA 2',3'-cyclic 3'-phosphodiesterase